MKKGLFLIVIWICFSLMAIGLITGDAFAQRNPKYIIRYCTENTLDTPWTAVGVRFGETLEKMTNGDVKTETYAGGSLAGGTKAMDMLKVGSIEIYVDAPGDFAVMYVPFSVFAMPYLFDNLDQVDRALDAKVSQNMFEGFRKATGLRVLGALCDGFRVCSTKKPLRTLADIKGLKMRVPPAPAYLETWKALGANPTPIDASELFTSLATGVVDGQENPLATIWEKKFYEVVKYLSFTDHQTRIPLYVMNDKFFQSLPNDYQAKANQAMREAVIWGRKQVRDSEVKYLKMLQEKGMVVVKPGKGPLKQATKDVYKKFLNEFDEKTYMALKGVK